MIAVARQGDQSIAQDAGGFVLETVDYGTGYRLLRVGAESEARQMVLAYVVRPLPEARALRRGELDGIVGRVATHYPDLRDRAREAWPRAL